MKRTFLTMMAALMVTFGAMAGKAPAAAGVAVTNDGTTLKLYYKGTAEANVKVSIFDADGKTVFTEVLKNIDGFIRPYNLASIPAGEYTISVADDNETHVEKVMIGRKPKVEVANLVRVRSEESKYLLTVPTKEPKDISVRILADDQVVYDEVQAITSDFARIYNLKDVKGSLTFEIKDQKGNTTVVSY